jgi:hypothetical protein
MLGNDGVQYQTSIPPGKCSISEVERMKSLSLTTWPKEAQELIELSKQPFVQVPLRIEILNAKGDSGISS